MRVKSTILDGMPKHVIGSGGADKRGYKFRRSIGIGRCEVCERVFCSSNGRQKYCCEECRKKAESDKRFKGIEDRTCKYCSIVFSPTNPNQYYCCDKCRENNSRKVFKERSSLVEKTCVNCESLFNPKSWNSTCCCRDCRKEYEAKLRKVKLESRECPNCGTLFKPKTGNHRYCCEECAKEFERKRKGIPDSKECELCSNVFKPDFALQHYCNKCRAKDRFIEGDGIVYLIKLTFDRDYWGYKIGKTVRKNPQFRWKEVTRTFFISLSENVSKEYEVTLCYYVKDCLKVEKRVKDFLDTEVGLMDSGSKESYDLNTAHIESIENILIRENGVPYDYSMGSRPYIM